MNTLTTTRAPAPLRLLNELARRGIVATAQQNRLVLDATELALDLRAPIANHSDVLIAILRLRQHAETRRRFEHWVCPDPRLLELWRAAEIACRCRLTIDGRRARHQNARW